MGWVLTTEHNGTDYDRIGDFAGYPELKWLNENHVVPPVAMAALLFVLGGWPALVWGFFVSTVVLWHATFAINSLTHMMGRRRYQTPDDSRNSLILALVTLGEGWHNNHHYYESTANNGFFWWEIDSSYYVLKVLSWFGLVWDLRLPPNYVLEGRDAARTRSDLAVRARRPAGGAGVDLMVAHEVAEEVSVAD
jgi:stearoyl-CoA desaturase (delta-9 desaturase)